MGASVRDRVRSQPASPAAQRRGRVWGPSQGPHFDRRAGDRELSSPLSRMSESLPWRPTRAHRERRPRPDGTCERGGAGRERRPCAAAFSDGVSRDVLLEPELGAAHHDVPGGGCTARGTGPARGSPRWAPARWSGPALAPERAPGEPRSRPMPVRAERQGPVRGARAPDRRAASPAPRRWSGRPCGRNLRKCSDSAGGGATAWAPAGPRHCLLVAVRNPQSAHQNRRPVPQPRSPVKRVALQGGLSAHR